MLICPGCGSRLVRVGTAKGVVFACAHCQGKAVAFSVLRKQARREFLNKLWMSAYSSRQRRGRACPHCLEPMALVDAPVDDHTVQLDVCTHCQCVWFDTREFEQVPALPPPEAKPARRMSPEAAEAAAMFELASQARRPAVDEAGLRGHVGLGGLGPGGAISAWQYLPAILGLPVEVDAPAVARRPLVTWALAGGMVVLFAALWAGGGLEAAIDQWGFIPDQWARSGGVTLLSGFFLHAGWFHLLSNMYFLMVFGDNVEDQLGRRRYLALLALAHLAGGVLHAALEPRGGIPAVGASAGISGVIGCYAVAFPRARIGILMRYFLVFGWLRIRAIWALALFVGLQLFGAWLQVQGFSNVSALAHLGGLAVGVLAAVWVKYF